MHLPADFLVRLEDPIFKMMKTKCINSDVQLKPGSSHKWAHSSRLNQGAKIDRITNSTASMTKHGMVSDCRDDELK